MNNPHAPVRFAPASNAMSTLTQMMSLSEHEDTPLRLDAGFTPAATWIRAYNALIHAHGGGRPVRVDLLQAEGCGTSRTIAMLPNEPVWQTLNRFRLERFVKTLLWLCGGWDICIDGADELVPFLKDAYNARGSRAFDEAMIGQKVYGHPLRVRTARLLGTPATVRKTGHIGGHLNGCRIGFDLGGSDRKCAAVIDGKTVFSEEIPWSPYFESDPHYHLEGIADSLRRAAAHLPRVDAIGGSAAGIYVDNSPRLASLFRGVPDVDFDSEVRPIFDRLKDQWHGVPFVVANDGDVSALAGAAMLKDNAVLGISMGTSMAAGYVDPSGSLTGWLNELAFVPVDYRENAPTDEWSGDRGCGVQYFSQQGVCRMAVEAGLRFTSGISAAETLEAVQARLKAGDARAHAVFEAVGAHLAHTLPLYADFYEIRHVLLLGRVLSGAGGEILAQTAQSVLANHYPQLNINLVLPDESFKRHGQAMTAASLPPLN